MFIEQVKSQYETHNVNPEMTQEKLWMLVTSAMDNSMKFKWLERWNNSTTFYETFKFLKSKFNDIEFLKWLHKATWWALMIIFLVLLFFGSLIFILFLVSLQLLNTFNLYFVFGSWLLRPRNSLMLLWLICMCHQLSSRWYGFFAYYFLLCGSNAHIIVGYYIFL